MRKKQIFVASLAALLLVVGVATASARAIPAGDPVATQVTVTDESPTVQPAEESAVAPEVPVEPVTEPGSPVTGETPSEGSEDPTPPPTEPGDPVEPPAVEPPVEPTPEPTPDVIPPSPPCDVHATTCISFGY